MIQKNSKNQKIPKIKLTKLHFFEMIYKISSNFTRSHQTSPKFTNVHQNSPKFTTVFLSFPKLKQGKKVCKATAVRCASLFLFAGIALKRQLVKWLPPAEEQHCWIGGTALVDCYQRRTAVKGSKMIKIYKCVKIKLLIVISCSFFSIHYIPQIL